jgi:hypothetical protein
MSRLIALCGRPGSGKSEVARILAEEFGYQIADDGLPLRKIAMDHLGLLPHQVFTQEGKLETVTLNGREWTCREILGEIGNAFEEKFGGDIIPLMTHMGQDSRQRYVMGSVRREQGRYWASKGALVVEVWNNFVEDSPFEFDRYNRAHVHQVIRNDFQKGVTDPVEALKTLRQGIVDVIGL